MFIITADIRYYAIIIYATLRPRRVCALLEQLIIYAIHITIGLRH